MTSVTVPDLEPRGCVGEREGGCFVPVLEPGGSDQARAARCVLMIVFTEEFWTQCYTIFILFVKWMII